MTDVFDKFAAGLESPATHLQSVTPSDTDDLTRASRGLNVETAGTIQVTTVAGAIGSVYVVAGVAFPIRVSRVWATGTTATGITALS